MITTYCRYIKLYLQNNSLPFSTYRNPLSEHEEKIKLFRKSEMLHKTNVRLNLLNEEETLIHNLHEEAVAKGHFTYFDPKTNERILTRLRHFLRRKCCGNACRHCVYDHDNVIDQYKLKVRRFNSSFWTYPDEQREVEYDDSSYFDGSNIKARRKNLSPTVTFGFDKL